MKLQTLVNLYVRLRDCGRGNTAPCISCSVPTPFDGSHGGHFIPTTYAATRFDENNIHHQCVRCNLFLHGNQLEYMVSMEKRYGREFVDDLMQRSRQPKKWTPIELEELIAVYKEKVKELEAQV